MGRSVLKSTSKIKRKSPSHVPHLLLKSDFGPSPAKTGMWGLSAIKSVYFFLPLGCFEGDFRMIWPQPDIWDPSTIKSIYFRSLGYFKGWFSHKVMMSPTCEVHVMVCPTCHVASFSLLLLYHTSRSATRARRVVLLCMLHHRFTRARIVLLVYLHRTSLSSLDDDSRAPSFWIWMERWRERSVREMRKGRR
jgi:hypothetical protein